jgi:hypothetical protein
LVRLPHLIVQQLEPAGLRTSAHSGTNKRRTPRLAFAGGNVLISPGFALEGGEIGTTTPMLPPTSKAEQFRARADDCFKQAENCSTEREKAHRLMLAEDWLKMAQDEVPVRPRRRA